MGLVTPSNSRINPGLFDLEAGIPFSMNYYAKFLRFNKKSHAPKPVLRPTPFHHVKSPGAHHCWREAPAEEPRCYGLHDTQPLCG